MKSQVTKAITLSGGAAILALAVAFAGGDLSPNGATNTRSSSIALAFGSSLHAGDPPCITDSINPCPQVADGVTPLPSPPRTHRVCQPLGRYGQHCYNRLLP